MKTIKRFFDSVRLLILVVILSVISLAVIAVSPGNKIPDENKAKTGFVMTEILPCPIDNADLGAGIVSKVPYPEQAIAKGIEGVVIIEFRVDKNGLVDRIKIVEDIGGGCGQAASNAISSMKFRPAVQNGYTVPCSVRVPVRFDLNSKAVGFSWRF
ncbi:MAG: energy transducer TonB [Bacteroidales bacterium]|nr:energy transducer TonB [Bacteroidales bacterium]